MSGSFWSNSLGADEGSVGAEVLFSKWFTSSSWRKQFTSSVELKFNNLVSSWLFLGWNQSGWQRSCLLLGALSSALGATLLCEGSSTYSAGSFAVLPVIQSTSCTISWGYEQIVQEVLFLKLVNFGGPAVLGVRGSRSHRDDGVWSRLSTSTLAVWRVMFDTSWSNCSQWLHLLAGSHLICCSAWIRKL